MAKSVRGVHEELWSKATDFDDFDRIGALAELASCLWGANQQAEAVEVGFELINSLDADFANVDRIRSAAQISSWLTELGRYEESKNLIDETLKLPSFTPGTAGIGFLHWNQARNFDEIGTPEENIHFLEKAVQCFVDNDQEILGVIRCELADKYVHAKLFDLAASEFRKGIQLLEEEGCGELVCKARQELGELLLEKGFLIEAMNEASDTLSLAKFLNHGELTQSSMLLLARVSSAQGEVEIAEQYFELAISQMDTKELKINAAIASYYQSLHWKSNGKAERAYARLKELVPVLRSFGEDRLSEQAKFELLEYETTPSVHT